MGCSLPSGTEAVPNRSPAPLLPASPLHEKLVPPLAGHDFAAWLIIDGMGFQDRNKWWDSGPRQKMHEGLDLVYYRSTTGGLGRLAPGHSVPAAYDGKVAKSLSDFLGKSVFLAHEIFDGQERRLYSVYGHTVPYPDLQCGQTVKAGAALARIAPAKPTQKVVPHLHLTLAWVPAALSPDILDWQRLTTDRDIELLDPAMIFPENCRQHLSRLPEPQGTTP